MRITIPRALLPAVLLAAWLPAGCANGTAGEANGPATTPEDGGSDGGSEQDAPVDTSHFDVPATCDNIETDPMNCGGCGRACEQRIGTRITCSAGVCAWECAAGWLDLDNDPATGCEYACVVTNNGVEVCDQADNDCNGVTDEGFDLNTSVENCGACGTPCMLSNAVAACQAGVCLIAQCQPGFYDNPASPEPDCDYPCAPTNGGVEICDGTDNDCNGSVDDSADTSSDILNCGSCGASCLGQFPHASPVCATGRCGLGPCDADYVDKNLDPADGCEYTCAAFCNGFPFAIGVCSPAGVCTMGSCLPSYYDQDGDPSNGCEYTCNPTNGGVEVCDGTDDNCNGLVDDNPYTASDPLNCGACAHSCGGAFPNAQPACQAGVCTLASCYPGYLDKNGDPLDGCEYSCESVCAFPFARGVCQPDGSCTFGQCLLGYYNLDQDPSNGCEYACSPTNNGQEACDARDNDCDKLVDEDFDLGTDANNCGVCGKRCEVFFPNSTTACQAVAGEAACVWTGCKPGFNNDDGQTANGCEYQCMPTEGGVEMCDGVDNDCDGLADNPPGGLFEPPLTEACSPDDPLARCRSKTVCQGGAAACVQVVGPAPEICNLVDDDCDGVTDEDPDGSGPLNLPQVGFACGTSQLGTCTFGTTVCQFGSIACVGAVGPALETCNGLDDDCNGVADNSPLGQGATCDLVPGSPGACKPGLQDCIGGTLVCAGGVGPQTEVCDGPRGTTEPSFDNNCDGAIDEGCMFAYDAPVRLDTNGSNVGASSSFQLSADTAGDDFLVAYGDLRAGSSNIYARVSRDAGSTWGANDFAVASDGAAEVEPDLFLRSGRAYLAYSLFTGSVRRIQVRSSDAAYTSWSAATKVDVPAAGDATIDCFAPSGVVARADSVATNDWIGVVWSDIAGTSANPLRNLRFNYSTTGGTSWLGTPWQVNSGAGADKGELPGIASDGAGMVYLVWRDKRSTGLAQVYFARVDLNAAIPSITDVRALQPHVASASAEEIGIAADTLGNVQVVWTDLRPATKTIRVASSNDHGATFHTVAGVVDGAVVNTDGTFADASSPSIAAVNGRVIVAWQDTRSGATDIRFNHSDDAGMTWQATTPRVDTGDGLGATTSLSPKVAFGAGDHVVVTWQDLRYPASAILANVSIDRGNTFHTSAGTALRMDIDTVFNPVGGSAADSQAPVILASRTSLKAAAVWVDFRNVAGATGQNGDIWTRLIRP